jgi:hypothetical protein
VKLETNGELAIKAVQSAATASRVTPSVTIPDNPPAYDPQANGCVQKGIQDANTQTRKTKLALERRFGGEIEAIHPIVEWGMEHSTFILSRCAVGSDGKAPFERLTGARWRGRAAEFGKQIQGKLASNKRRQAQKKLKPRLVPGTWVGATERSGEHKMVTHQGRAIRVRTIKRVPWRTGATKTG